MHTTKIKSKSWLDIDPNFCEKIIEFTQGSQTCMTFKEKILHLFHHNHYGPQTVVSIYRCIPLGFTHLQLGLSPGLLGLYHIYNEGNVPYCRNRRWFQELPPPSVLPASLAGLSAARPLLKPSLWLRWCERKGAVNRAGGLLGGSSQDL